jgi:hypothetical protein
MGSRCIRKPYRDGHVYELDGQRVPGVTTVLGKTIDKPGLRAWYAHQAGLWVMEQDPGYLQVLPPQELKRRLQSAPNLRRDQAAAEGKTLHAYAEALGAGEEIEPTSELAARAELVADFLDRYRVSIVAAELTVWHERLAYAGTLDVIADLWMDGRWVRWLLDYKTGAGIYPDHVLQAAAYRYATHAVVHGNDVPMAEVESVGIVHVTASGWALHPVRADNDAFHAFEAATRLHHFLTTKPDELVAPALAHPTTTGAHA